MNYFFPVYVNQVPQMSSLMSQNMMMYPMNHMSRSHSSSISSLSGKFDLNTFKTIECKIKTYHDHKQCSYHHSDKDKRRNLNIHKYMPDLCPGL